MKNRMKSAMGNNSGFTLIELVMVIVILGTLAAVAVPKFLDLSSDADQAAVDGVAGSLGSASAINYAACAVGNASCTTVTNCSQVDGLLEGGLPTGYTITAGAVTAGATATCTITGNSSLTATFVVHGT